MKDSVQHWVWDIIRVPTLLKNLKNFYTVSFFCKKKKMFLIEKKGNDAQMMHVYVRRSIEITKQRSYNYKTNKILRRYWYVIEHIEKITFSNIKWRIRIRTFVFLHNSKMSSYHSCLHYITMFCLSLVYKQLTIYLIISLNNNNNNVLCSESCIGATEQTKKRKFFTTDTREQEE